MGAEPVDEATGRVDVGARRREVVAAGELATDRGVEPGHPVGVGHP